MSRGLYLYAFVRPAEWCEHLHGVGGAPVELLRHGAVGAAVSEVPLVELELPDEEVTEGSRVAAMARRHDDVVRALCAVTTVLPLQLGTVVRRREDVRQLIMEQYDEASRALDEVVGALEWGASVRAHGESTPRKTSRSESGTAYLARRKAALQQSESERDRHTALAEHAAAALGAVARESVRTSRGGNETITDLAYLVDEVSTDGFLSASRRLAEQLEAAGAGLTITGPWPPYTFARSKLSANV